MSLQGFDFLNMEDSFLLGIIADGDDLLLRVEFALNPDHPVYAAPLAGEVRCYRRGEIRISDLQIIDQQKVGAALGCDPNGGNLDLGSIGIYETADGYLVDTDWVRVVCRAKSIIAHLFN